MRRAERVRDARRVARETRADARETTGWARHPVDATGGDVAATWSARRVITPRARVERAHIATRRARTHAGEAVTSIEGARGTFERTRGCVCV